MTCDHTGHVWTWGSSPGEFNYRLGPGTPCRRGEVRWSEPVYTEFRPDGWPLCPKCGQDELWCDMWDGREPKPTQAEFIAAIQGCYACHWSPEMESTDADRD